MKNIEPIVFVNNPKWSNNIIFDIETDSFDYVTMNFRHYNIENIEVIDDYEIIVKLQYSKEASIKMHKRYLWKIISPKCIKGSPILGKI